MSISVEEVDRIAKLSRLKFEATEKQKLQKELSAILEYVDQLKEVSGEAESSSGGQGLDPDAVNLMRDDIAEPLTPPEKLLKLAPNTEDNFYKVKSVLE